MSCRRRYVALAFILAAAQPLAGCREAAKALGPTPAQARENAGELIHSLAVRFGPIQLDSAAAAARIKFARGALVPSRLYDDWDVWTAAYGDARTLEEAGAITPDGTGYRLAVRAGAATPSAAGDYRRVMHLRPAGDKQYEWRVRDELAVGAVRTSDLGEALTAVLSGPERADGESLRADARRVFPRASDALGRLVSLDTLRTARAADGATEVWLAATIRPRRLAPVFPSYAKYLEKYVTPLAYSIELFDDAGARWGEARSQGGHLTLRFRVAGGNLAPLDAPPRRIPERFHARIDATAKMFLFRVGVRQLVGDVTLTRAPDEAGFTARFRREPDWVFPPLVRRMLRSPLRRPFQGEGAMLAYRVRDGGAGPTLAVRDYEVAVQESAIVRWLGGLGNSALSDFRQGAEREADAFVGQFWSALRADVGALEPAATTGGPEPGG